MANLPGFLSAFLTPYTPVGAGGDGYARGVHQMADRRQQQGQFEVEQARLRERALAQQLQFDAEQARLREGAQAQQEYQRGLLGQNDQRLREQQRQFDATQKVGEQKRIDAAMSRLNEAMMSANQDQVDLAMQDMLRMGFSAQEVSEMVDAGSAPAPPPQESEAAKQLERDAMPEWVKESAQQGAPSEAPQQGTPPGFNVQPKALPPGLAAPPGAPPMSAPPDARPPAPFNPFTGAAFAVPQQGAPQQPQPSQVRARPPAPIPGGLAARMGQPSEQTIVLRDQNGNVAGVFRPQAIRERAMGEVDSVMQSLAKSAKTPEEQAAAETAAGIARHMIGQKGLGPKEAIAAGLRFYEKAMGRDTAKAVSGAKSGDGGAFGGSMVADTGLDNMDFRLQGEARQIANNMSLRYKVPELQAAAHEGEKLLAKIRSGSAVSQNEAINSLVKMAQGSRPSDADREFTLKSGGQMNLWRTKVDSWIAGGKLPEDFRLQIESYASVLAAYNAELRAKIMQRARESIMQNPLFGRLPPDVQSQYADWVSGHTTGEFRPGGTVRGEQAPQGGGSSTGKQPKSKAPASDDIMEGL